MPRSNAKRQADYRARKGSRCGGKGGKNSKWNVGEFIALDGEGENYGDIETFAVPGGKTYHAQAHRYTLLAASSGESLYNAGNRLETMACLDFLLDLATVYKKGIFVIFAGSYDINHMLLYGIGRSCLSVVAGAQTYAFSHEDIEYRIEYRPRKSLTLRRGLSWKCKKDGKYSPVWASKIVIWDVWGFFQDSFTGVMAKWLGKEHRHYELIRRMKLQRGDFINVSQSDINAYNAAELECLVEIMDKVREAIGGLDLKCARWDGAGAIAAALMRKHELKQFKALTPPGLETPVATAYAGGRIEVCKIGRHDGPVWDYDINSAYPDVMRTLPCLAHGIWKRGTGAPPSGFTLVHCEYAFADGLPFYPLFYRTRAMQICFPSRGEGIYWYPEYEAALLCPGNVDVIEWWHFEPECNHKPFHWIEDYYKTRQRWIKNPDQEWQRGAEKIIKLGLNSLYGKSAQQVGGRENKPPAYHQMEWAGYITSATRARLYTAAMHAPDTIIGFATDGIFATGPLPFPHSDDKSIGCWDVKIFDGLTLAMAGVYWWHDKPGEGGLKPMGYKHFSRGFDKEAMESPDFVIEAWKRGLTGVDVKMRRLIGMGSACASDTFWAMRGRFTEGMRTLALNGQSYKRGAIDIKRDKPYKKLVATQPAYNIQYENGMQTCSHAYPLGWQRDDDYKNELEQEAENHDTENV